MTETGNTYNSEQDREEPAPLQDAMIRYTLAAASKRKELDALVATWQSWLHSYLKLTYSSPQMIHKVIDSMDDWLNHRSRK